MAGIYIHIPFCRQACHYCDFHFSTNLRNQADMVDAICLEIENRRLYLNDELHTIYFGGGTPSLLSKDQLELIISTVRANFSIALNAEITLEANPEDLDTKKLTYFKRAGVNRLSIGIQTFHDEKLKWMNRAHSSHEATSAFENAREVGFENISLDLIYARPNENPQYWMDDLQKIVELNPEHISIYGLTIEDKTVFGKWERDKKLIQLPEEEAAEQYIGAIDYLTQNGYNQYEVSNFCKNGFESRHNSAYWAGIHYLGIGPGAHSFNGDARHINIKNNTKYIHSINSGVFPFEEEYLSDNQKINEIILTQLRTSKGLDFEQLKENWRIDLSVEHESFIMDLVNQKLAQVDNRKMKLLPHGFLIADEIALRLFIHE